MNSCLTRNGGDPFCLTSDGMRTWDEFCCDVASARPIAGEHDALCNLIPGRYRFSVSLAACICDGVPVLLPASRAPNAIQAALSGWQNPGYLTDDWMPDRNAKPIDPSIFQNSSAPVYVFTSGSTGKPVLHRKNWTSLAGGADLTTQILGRAGLAPSDTVIAGTTPHQHMYGLEASLFAGLAGGFCLYDQTVFYPEDLLILRDRARLARIRNIALMASPVHLRYLAETIRQCPEISCVISATAPLHRTVATEIEDGDVRHLYEIYGSTETGSMAWRRPSIDEIWRLLDGFQLSEHAEGWSAHAPHLDAPVVLNDHLSVDEHGGFHLTGRKEDFVQVGGKRESLGALNAALLAMKDLSDGVVLRRPGSDGDRLAILIVPKSNPPENERALAQRVRQHMMRNVDPVFVPKRIQIISQLTRTKTGKIPAEDLRELHSSAFSKDALGDGI